MRKIFIISLILFTCGSAALADIYDDDIYYNPKKDVKSKIEKNKNKKQSQYIENFGDLDVDTYNRRGYYYASPIDTIGKKAENGEDFVYTQQIQKFYNPTIVVDNADVLEDLINNSYGNVEIVIENGYPMFSSYYNPWSSWNSPWYYGYSSWGWGSGWYDPWYSWGPSWSWGWGPSWSWNWGPGWGWGPSWAWGPSWTWGPGWGPGWIGGSPSYSHYRPQGNRPVGPGYGWASNTRPGSNYNGSAHRPVHNINSVRPGYGNVATGSNPTSAPGNYHRGGITTNNGLHGMRPANNTNTNDRGYIINSSGHRVTGSSNMGNSTNTNNNRQGYNRNNNTNTNRNYNYDNSTNRRTNSYNSGSFNSGGSHRSSGGSFGGGGARGRHR